MFKNLTFLSIFLILKLSPVASDHIALIRCGEMESCWPHIDSEVVRMLKDNMHNATDPCVNFWDYACGDWTAAPYYDHEDNFGAVDNFYVEKMEIFLLGSGSRRTWEANNILQKMSMHYHACRTVEDYFPPMFKYWKHLPDTPSVRWPDMHTIFSNGPWNLSSNFNWLSAVAELRRFGLNGVLIDESIGVAFNDSRRLVIKLKMPNPHYGFQNTQELLNLFQEFGWLNRVNAQNRDLATSIYDFESHLQALQKKYAQEEEDEDPVDFSLTLEKLKQKVPNIDWQTYFNIILESIAIDEHMPIELFDWEYYRDMATVLEQSDNKIVCLYLAARLCKYLLEIRPLITEKNCVDHMGVVMPLGMNFIYNYYVYQTRAEDERILREIFNKLKMQFSKYLLANKLNLSKSEVEYLNLKLMKMSLRLGNLPRHKSLSSYNHHYDAVNLTTTNFFRNHWELLRFRTSSQHRPFVQSNYNLDLDEFYVNDDIQQIRNAPYFVHQLNMLIVPMVFPLLPFFHHRQHPIFQYSLMGWILAHELNHAFETDGILLNADGNEGLLGEQIANKIEFQKEVKCFTRRRQTAALIERIADVNGFQLVYDTYFNKLPSHESLPISNEFTTQQLFFLNFAQFFCGKLPLPIDHDRDDIRVMEIVANMREFGESFNCGVEAEENPTEKCEMWRN